MSRILKRFFFKRPNHQRQEWGNCRGRIHAIRFYFRIDLCCEPVRRGALLPDMLDLLGLLRVVFHFFQLQKNQLGVFVEDLV